VFFLYGNIFKSNPGMLPILKSLAIVLPINSATDVKTELVREAFITLCFLTFLSTTFRIHFLLGTSVL
jgi:hypothetical protein